MENLSLHFQKQAHSSQGSYPTGLPSCRAPSPDVAPTDTVFTSHTAPGVAEASAQGTIIASTQLSVPAPENQVDRDYAVEDVSAYSSLPSCSADAPSCSVSSQDVGATGAAFIGHAAPAVVEPSAQGTAITPSQLNAPAAENQVDRDYAMEDVSVYSSQPSCPADPPSRGAPSQNLAAAGAASPGHAAPAVAGASAQGAGIVSALSEKRSDKDHPVEDFSSCPPAQDYRSRLLAHQPSTPSLPEPPSPPHSTRLSSLDSRCLIFQNLASGVTIDDIAERLSAPAAEGGCGVSITSSAPVSSFNSAAFVTEFASIHEARLARAGWSSDNPVASVDAAPSPLLLTIKLKPYQRPSASRWNKNSRQGNCSPKPSTPNRSSVGPCSAPHRHSPYSLSSRPPGPKEKSTRPVLLAAHHRFGYMARKRLISADQRGTSFTAGSSHPHREIPGGTDEHFRPSEKWIEAERRKRSNVVDRQFWSY